MTRTLLLECLEEAEEKSFGNLAKRLAIARRSSAWEMMDADWRGLLFNLMKNDAQGESKGNKGRRKIGRRGGRGDRAMLDDFDLEPIESLTSSVDGADYRLATLLTHKTILGEDWDNKWNTKMHEMRSHCEVNGVHPVFHLLADKFQSVLGEMSVYDSVEEDVSDDPAWLELCRIDPTDNQMLISILTPPIGIQLKATQQAPLKRLHDNMERKRGVKSSWLSRQLDLKLLEERDGSIGLLVAILSYAAGSDDAEERFNHLSETEGIIGEIAATQLLLIKIRNNDLSIWQECISLPQENSLNEACRAEAWARMVDNETNLSVKELIEALAELSEWAEIREVEVDPHNLKWAIVSQMAKSGNEKEASQYFEDLTIENDFHLTTSLNLLETECHDLVVEKLESTIESQPNLDLSTILEYGDIPVSVRLSVSDILGVSGSTDEKTEEMMLELHTSQGNIPSLAKLLSSNPDAHKTNPHLTLVTARLIGAESSTDLLTWASDERRKAFRMLNDVKIPSYLSESAFALASLLDGGIADLEKVSILLDADGIQLFKQCRRAMMEDGDGLVPELFLEKLSTNIKEREMGQIEMKLFTQLILSLRLNRADSLLQQAERSSLKKAENIIDGVLQSAPPTYRLMKNINEQVLEHGVASSALEKWYRSNKGNSIEAAIALGRFAEKNGNRLQAARSYKTAASRCDDFELRQKLNKEALISFAHSGSWPEAIELLESESGLSANITERFKLYLKVNDEADRGNLEKATKMILNDVSTSKMIEKTNDEGETYEVEQTTYSQEELNLHHTYPSIYRLPEEPFCGRVLAAINRIKSGRKYKGSDREHAFQRALMRKDLTEIYQVANRAATDLGAEHGLLFYERAIDSGKFDIKNMSELAQMETCMYSRTEDEIPVRKRMHLANLALKPLVVVDTNLLVDALAENVLKLLEIERDVPMHLDSRREFHKTLLYRQQQGRLEIYIPPATRNELRSIATIPGRVRSICGDRLIDPKLWDKKITDSILTDIADDVISTYNSWTPPKNESINEEIQSRRPDFEMFFAGLRGVYQEITEAKLGRGHSQAKRIEIKGEALYPEAGDIDIMLFSAYLAEQSLEGFGSILVASRDSDFTVPGRALQERFGFIIVDNAQALSRYTY